MRNFSATTCLVVLALFCGGCVTHSGIVETDPGVYVATDQAATSATGVENPKANALRDAEVFCADKHKSVQLIRSSESRRRFYFGIPQVAIEFSCVDADGQRPRARVLD